MASASTSDKGKASTDTDECVWKCPLCLDSLKHPKLLPCSHSFCTKCLENLVSYGNDVHGSSAFHCPTCRELIKVPKGGVSSFKNNYYLETVQEKRNSKPLCKIHDSRPRELEQFCIECQVCICLKCKLEDHSNHDTRDIEEVTVSAKERVTIDRNKLKNTICKLKERAGDLFSEVNAIDEKKDAISRDIQRRHRMIVAAADRYRDDALFSLNLATTCMHSEADDLVKKMRYTLDELSKLKKRMDKCLNSKEDGMMLITAKEIYKDAIKHEENVSTLVSYQTTTHSRPVLRFSASADFVFDTACNFLGHIDRMNVTAGNQEMNIKKLFCCTVQNSLCDVVSLFPVGNNFVWIYFEPDKCRDKSGSKIDGKLFDRDGNLLNDLDDHPHFSNILCDPGLKSSGFFSTFAKSARPFQLQNNMCGTASLAEVVFPKKTPASSHSRPLSMIHCGPHRAFDLDEKRVHLVVIEEARLPEMQRKVHLYGISLRNPGSIYVPPTQPFQPSDVCFYKLFDIEVLLVSDEANDAIHVVGLEEGRLKFLRFLAPGCALLLQPQALNTDNQGNLWVACRGGSVLLFEPKSL